MKKTTRLHSWLLKFDRAFSDKIWRQIFILLSFVAIAFLIGVLILYFLHFGTNGAKVSFYEWALYLLIDGNALNNLYFDDYPNGGRGWVVLFGILGTLLGVILFGGMLISVLSNMLERRIENYRKGKNLYVIDGHYIILGYDEIVPSIIKEICKNPNAYVLLQSSLPGEEIAELIHSSIAQDCERRVIFKNGHRKSLSDLEELRLPSASEIYIVGNRENPSHDATNIDCLEKVALILKKSKEKNKGNQKLPERIITVFEDPDTYAAIQVSDLFDNIRSLGIEFIPYNFYNAWTKQMMVDNHYIDNNKKHLYPTLDREGIKPGDEQHVHLVIVGISTFGVTVAIEAAKFLHFPNFSRGKNLTRITFIALNADKEIDLFFTRFRHFFEVQDAWINGNRRCATKFKDEDANFLDVEFEFIQGDIFSDKIQKMIAEWSSNPNEYLSLVFAMKDPRLNLAGAMNLPDEVYERNIPVFVRQNSSSKFLSLIHSKSEVENKKIKVVNNEVIETPVKGKYFNLYPFGMTDIPFDSNHRAQRMAECINHIYNISKSKNWETPTYEEVTKASWDEIHSEWMALDVALQWANLYAAYNMEYRIRTLKAMRGNDSPIDNVTDKEADILAGVEHNRWNVEKLLHGYRKPSKEEDANNPDNFIDGKKYTPMKDAHKALYIHSDIRPYHTLDEIQEIDRQIIRFIPWIVRISKN